MNGIMAIIMKHIKVILFFVFFVAILVSAKTTIEDELLAFSKCHNIKTRVVKTFYKDDNLMVLVSDTLFSFNSSKKCSEIKVEYINQTHMCKNSNGDISCFVVALDDLSDSLFLTLEFPIGNEKKFYLQKLDGTKKRLKGDMLWGIRRMPAFMKKNVVILLHRNEKNDFELITYKIEGGVIKEKKRVKYPYPMRVNSWNLPLDYIFPCDGKMCIFNENSKKFFLYQNEFFVR